jgi:long-chain fatty acid transport protein
MRKILLTSFTLLCSLPAHASFIEATMGTAVVNDATATYFNPAALILLKNPQAIGLGSYATYHSRFTGQSVQAATGFVQTGSATTQTHYVLPSLYFGTPITDKVTLGFAVIANFFHSNPEEHSVLRYVQASNSTRDVDLVPAIGVKLNDYFSLGAGLNISRANMSSEPITGLPSLNIPDNQSQNDSSGMGYGAHAGFLLRPALATLIGFNYRSAVTYHLSGKSVFMGSSRIVSNHYGFNFWTPARSTLSISQFVSPIVGFIGTVEYIQWNIFNTVNIHGVATQVGLQPVILNASVPYHFHNAWVFTLGGLYRATPNWIIRVAGSYLESPGNNHYQLVNGDSIVLGASMGYTINNFFTIDGSYAHAFIQNQNIFITSGRNRINGVNTGARNAVSLKLTFNA